MWYMHVRMGGSLVLVAGLGLLVWWESRRRNRRRLQVPTQWRQVGKLASLTVFPLKSGRGIPLKEGECTEIGLRTLGQGAAHLRDRFFVIYGDKYFDHKNAKTYPKMVLISISSEKEGEVTFEAPGMPVLKLQVPDHANKLNDKYCLLWLNDKVKTLDCGEEVASWMSRYILDKESGVRLGYHLEHVTQRNAYKPPWSAFRVFYDKLRTKDIVSSAMGTHTSSQYYQSRVSIKIFQMGGGLESGEKNNQVLPICLLIGGLRRNWRNGPSWQNLVLLLYSRALDSCFEEHGCGQLFENVGKICEFLATVFLECHKCGKGYDMVTTVVKTMGHLQLSECVSLRRFV
uniref:Molybdenum cofactor sulfurase middle domain-containing protein n=1 Tax=Timema cristinae TaxID=61476 RepID=A0A7R9CN05_TIMCR|nr:unnamed protein product [Timema cristinae]